MRSININKKGKNYYGYKLKCKLFKDRIIELYLKLGKVGLKNDFLL